MRTLRLLPAAAAVCLAVSCGDGTDPNPPGSVTSPAGIWDATVSGLQVVTPGGPVTCTADWVTSIEAVAVETFLMRIPANSSLRCGQSEPVTWAEAGQHFIALQSGDTLAFLSSTTFDSFLVARFTDTLTLSGPMVDAKYAGATFRATRRSGTVDPNRSPYRFWMSVDWVDLEVGDSLTVTPYVYDAYWERIADPPDVTIFSKAPQIATVDEAGIVRGVAPGQVEIRAVLDSFVDALTLIVQPPAASVEITSTPDSLILPDTVYVGGVARASGGEILFGRRFHWTSSNPAVATVSEYGEYADIASVAPGTVTITARSTTQTASVTFDVLPAADEDHR